MSRAFPPPIDDQLFALPLTGESFLLRRQGRTVLVDGGCKKDRVADVLSRNFPTLEALDIVVCTHGDGDHAGGLPELIKNWPGRIGQVWLPGRWRGVVPQLLNDPKGFVRGLISELNTIGDEDVAGSSWQMDESEVEAEMERYTVSEREKAAQCQEQNAGTWPHEPAEQPGMPDWDGTPVDLGATEPLDEPSWFAELRRAVDRFVSDREASNAFNTGRRQIGKRRADRKVAVPMATFWLGLIDSCEAIRGVAETAIRRACRVRWFDFDSFSQTRQAAGGVRGFLVPVNATEQPPPPPLALSRLLMLSQANRESLVFLAPPVFYGMGVLFCGDSPLGDGPGFSQSFLAPLAIRPCLMVATAPHHGAESNSAAYGHLAAWRAPVMFLRTGGSCKQPGPTFKSLPLPIRVCASCRQSGRPPVLTGVAMGRHLNWLPCLIITGAPCACV